MALANQEPNLAGGTPLGRSENTALWPVTVAGRHTNRVADAGASHPGMDLCRFRAAASVPS